MREALRQLLIAGVPSVDARVFEPHAMTLEDGLPAIIVRYTSEARPADHQGPTQTVEIWPYTSRERFTDLDLLTEEIKQTLSEAHFTETDEHGETIENGRHYYVEHQTTGTDTLDEQWGGITRAITFDVHDLAWLDGATYSPDPVGAMTAWTQQRFDLAVQTDPRSWYPSVQIPGVYWRMDAMPRILEHYPEHSTLEARLRGHILTPSKQGRYEWTRRLHETLALERRVYLDDGSPLYLLAVGADSTAHMIRDGQITLVTSYGVLRPPADVETLQTVTVNEA